MLSAVSSVALSAASGVVLSAVLRTALSAVSSAVLSAVLVAVLSAESSAVLSAVLSVSLSAAPRALKLRFVNRVKTNCRIDAAYFALRISTAPPMNAIAWQVVAVALPFCIFHCVCFESRLRWYKSFE